MYMWNNQTLMVQSHCGWSVCLALERYLLSVDSPKISLIFPSPRPVEGLVRVYVCVFWGGGCVETSKVPMPRRPLGSSSGRCDVWGRAALPSSLLVPFPLAWCPPLHVQACLLPVYWGGEDSHPSHCLPCSINTNTTGTTLTFIWQNKLLTSWPVQLDRNFLWGITSPSVELCRSCSFFPPVSLQY